MWRVSYIAFEAFVVAEDFGDYRGAAACLRRIWSKGYEEVSLFRIRGRDEWR